MPAVEVTVREETDGWTAQVMVKDKTTTSHRVRISRAEYARYGGGDVRDLVRRSFEFLLARETNTSILPEFSLSDIERYFTDYGASIRRPA
jgi:hypothetical protein